MLGKFVQQDCGFAYSIGALCVFGGYMYQFGGQEAPTGAQAATDCNIRSAKILEDGSLAPAKIVGTTPTPRRSMNVVQYGDYVFLIGGGQSGVTSNLVSRYKLGPSGSISAAVPLAPMQLVSGSVQGWVEIGDFRYGWRLTTSNQLWAFKMTSDGPQQVQAIALLPNAASCTNGCLVAYRNNLIYVGGTIGGTGQTAVWAAKTNGLSISPWVRVGELPSATLSLSCNIVDNKLVVLGGLSSPGLVALDTVLAAPLDDDGRLLGPFKELGRLPTACYGVGSYSSVVTPTHIYLHGGNDTAGTTLYNIVQYARILRGV